MKKIAILITTLCLMQSVHAQTITSTVPGFISYQGRALNSSGTVMGSGTPVNRTVTFRIWDHASNSLAANLIYSEQQVVTIAEGEFSVLVGAGGATAGTPLGYSETAKGPPTVRINDLGVFAGATRFLGVTIDDGTVAVDNEVSPRQQIVSSAYALRARYAEQLGSNGTTALTALDSGNVGIGNPNPPSRFTISAAGTGTSTPQLLLTADDTTERLRIGVDSTGTGTGFIQSFKEGTGVQNLLLNPSGGNVGIGTASPAVALSVTGAITATGAITGGSLATAGNITTSSGSVGIGTTTPTAKLTIGPPLGGSESMLSTSFLANAGALGTAAASELNLGNFGFTGPNNNISLAISAYRTAIGNGFGDTALLLGYNVDNSRRHNGGYISIHSSGNVGIGEANPSSKLTVNGNAAVTGNVVIGTSTPGIPLSMGSSVGDKISLWGSSGNTYGFGIQNGLLQIHTNDVATDVAFGYGSSAAMTETMRIKGSGKVGIGTTTPSDFLSVEGGGQVETASTSTAVAHFGGADVHTYFGSYNGAGSYAPWLQAMRKSDSQPFPMAINPNGGNVGIGTKTPTARLDVNGTARVTSKLTVDDSIGIGTSTPSYPLHVTRAVNRLYNGSSAKTTNQSSTSPQIGNPDRYTADGYGGMGSADNWATSIYADGVVAGTAFVAMSDRRIKDIVDRSSARGDLNLINQLKVTDYRLKDRIGSGSALHKGFIAQEVRKVIPEAVSASRNYLPDIYLPAMENLYDAAQKRLSVTLAKPHALAVGDWVRIFGDETPMETEVLAVLSPTSFTVASEEPVAKAFVYGRRVDDFLAVDYDRIFTTGIGAIQELDRQLKEKDAKIAALEAKVAAQDKRSTAQADEVTSQNARLVALEKLINKSSPPETVSIKLGEQ
jgi:hypothetical protein